MSWVIGPDAVQTCIWFKIDLVVYKIVAYMHVYIYIYIYIHGYMYIFVQVHTYAQMEVLAETFEFLR